MNTYIIPIFDYDSVKVWNEVVKARSFEDAKNKVINIITTEYDLDFPEDWEDFKEILSNNNIEIGKLQDVEEF